MYQAGEFIRKNSRRKEARQRWGGDAFRKGRRARRQLLNGGAFGDKPVKLYNYYVVGTMGWEKIDET